MKDYGTVQSAVRPEEKVVDGRVSCTDGREERRPGGAAHGHTARALRRV